MSDTAPWFHIGHVTHEAERTGCTVVVFDQLSPACVDVRGGAPGTRETALLEHGRLVGAVNALAFAGGSAFGLAVADGVMRYLAEHGQGFATLAGPVPIVPAAVVFDLTEGAPRHPTADDGYAAAAVAGGQPWLTGRVGAGAGATIAKLGGGSIPGGLGVATTQVGETTVTAALVLNAVGDVRDPETGRWLARASATGDGRALALQRAARSTLGASTTIGAVLLDTRVDRDTLQRCCVAAHDALARCVVPAHTLYDGDTFFAVSRASGEVEPATILALQAGVEIAVERAIVGLFEEH